MPEPTGVIALFMAAASIAWKAYERLHPPKPTVATTLVLPPAPPPIPPPRATLPSIPAEYCASCEVSRQVVELRKSVGSDIRELRDRFEEHDHDERAHREKIAEAIGRLCGRQEASK